MNDADLFERTVAQLFRDAGAHVQQDIDLAGNQIDLLVTFRVFQIPISMAVECKYYNARIGIGLVNRFATVMNLLRSLPGSNKIDKGVLVSRVGFTRHARKAAFEHSIDLRSIDDLIACISGMPAEELVGTYGSEAYTMIDAMDGISLDEKRTTFWHLFNSACRMRKWSPEVDQSVLWDRAHACHELAVNLDDVHRAAAYMLDGVLHYDQKQFAAAEERFKDALAVATDQLLKPINLQASFWQARCFVERAMFPEALALLERCWSGSQADRALATFKVKAQYWYAKVCWIAYQNGDNTRASKEIKELFRDCLHMSDKLGIVNYREGARARLAEIAIQEGNAQYGLEELLKSYELTPNLQDRRKLEAIIARACLEIPETIKSNIAETVRRRLESFRWLADVRHPSDVQVCEFAVWRFSKFKRTRVLPHIDGTNSNWVDGTRLLLEDPELFQFCVDSEGGNQETSLTPSAGKSQNKYSSLRAKLCAKGDGYIGSDLKHRLRMCRRLFFSSTLVNDTGERGSLSLVALNREADSRILERRDCNFQMDGDNGFSCKATTIERLPVSSRLAEDLRHITTKLTEKAFENVQTRGVFPVSLDFLIDSDKAYLLEFHYPSRGFQVLYEPFSDLVPNARWPVDIFASQLDRFVTELRATSILLTHNSLFLDDTDRPRSQFYGFEFQQLADKVVNDVKSAQVHICSDWHQTSRRKGVIEYQGITPEVVILDDIDPQQPILSESSQLLLPNAEMIRRLSDRSAIKSDCEKLGITTPAWRELRPGEDIDYAKLEDSLGSLIVAKERFHLPSWHAQKRRCEFIDLKEKADRKRLERWATTSQLIVEKLITTSVDKYDHCGELRLHACVLV